MTLKCWCQLLAQTWAAYSTRTATAPKWWHSTLNATGYNLWFHFHLLPQDKGSYSTMGLLDSVKKGSILWQLLKCHRIRSLHVRLLSSTDPAFYRICVTIASVLHQWITGGANTGLGSVPKNPNKIPLTCPKFSLSPLCSLSLAHTDGEKHPIVLMQIMLWTSFSWCPLSKATPST